MSQLTLVRHGQATFPYQNQDQLTGTGQTQARLLGSFWAAQRMEFDRVYTGPGGRHVETAALAGEVLRDQGLPWPPAVVLESLDEYQAGAMLNLGLTRLREVDQRLDRLWEVSESTADPREKERAWSRMFGIVLRLWAHEEVRLDGVEPWKDFCARVERGLSEIITTGEKGQLVAAFTSGGPIGVATRHALQTSTEKTLEMAWMVRNASLTEFLFSQDRFTLSTFNTVPHLREPSVLTYR